MTYKLKRKKFKLSSFIDNMVVYIKHLEEFIKIYET